MRAKTFTRSLFTLVLLLLLLSFSQCTSTVVVDGLDEWKAPTSLRVGDSLVFKHKHLQNLYLFHNRRAFDLCNFARAYLIYNGDSTHFTWTPSRAGYYYFSTSKPSCNGGQKLPVRVLTSSSTPSDLSPSLPLLPAPPPTAGGDFSSSPSHGWGWVPSSPGSHSHSPAPETSPLVPKEGAPLGVTPVGAPESGIPFLSSNPAVPLPTGVTDSASIRPFSTPGDGTQEVGLGSSTVRNGKGLVVVVMIMFSTSILGLWM